MSDTKNTELHLPTQIDGLDDLLRDGFVLPYYQEESKQADPEGLIILIKGFPGTGKTTLAMQLAGGTCKWDAYINALSNHENMKTLIKQHQEVSIFSNEQNRSELEGLLTRLGIKNDKKINIEDCAISKSSELPLNANPYTVEWALGVNEKITHLEKQRMVIIDGFNLLSSADRENIQIEELIKELRKKTLITILIYDTEGERKHHLDYITDMTISLREEISKTEPRYLLNYIKIDKGRFQSHVLGWHQYKILKKGIVIYPSLHYRSHKSGFLDDRLEESQQNILSLSPGDSAESVEPDNSALNCILGEEYIKKGSCTIILGARRTWKTLLSLDFLRAGSKNGEKGLLVSLIDNQSTIVGQRTELCKAFCLNQKTESDFENCKSTLCYKNVHLFHFRPGCITPSEFIYYLTKSIKYHKQKGKPIERIVFWDMAQLEYRFPLFAKDTLFIPLLMDYLKHEHKISSLFMGASNAKISHAASAIADNVIFCWQDMITKECSKEECSKEECSKEECSEEKRSGVAFYVDRIEGKPESGRLFFKLKETDNSSTDTPIENIIKPEEFINLYYANTMREQIWAMQGLNVTVQGRNLGGHDKRVGVINEQGTLPTPSRQSVS